MEQTDFEFIKELNRGGMAEVHLVRQKNLDRLIALKLMSRRLNTSDEFRSRFLREARIVAKLNHPNIITIYDVGELEGRLAISMEYLPGGDLKSKIQRGIAPVEALRILKDLAQALVYAHDENYLHRDIKPENILFDANNRTVLTDFGISKPMDADATRMTQTGVALGTPAYMAPEQFEGREIDTRADLYSLGVVFYQMLTGQQPYSAASTPAYMYKHFNEPIPRLENDLFLQPLIDRLLAKLPESRIPSAMGLVDEIHTLLGDDHPTEIPSDPTPLFMRADKPPLGSLQAESVFFCYAKEDEPLRHRLYKDLQEMGCPVWTDQHNIVAGKHLDTAIESAIDHCEIFIVLLSRNSVASEPVLDEIYYALDSQKHVIPVIADECSVPLRLRRLESIRLGNSYRSSLEALANIVTGTPAPASRAGEVSSFAYHPDQKLAPSIVVLPFEPMTDHELNMVFSDGLLTGIAGSLSIHKEFFVIASGTARTYRGKNLDVRSIGIELRVDYAVMGQIAIVGETIRVTCELINTRNGSLVWSDSLTRDLTDIFDVQNHLSASVTHQVSRKIGLQSRKVTIQKAPIDLTAWEMLQTAMYYEWRYEWLVESIKLLRAAIEIDDSLAEAHALLAARLAYMMWFGEIDQLGEAIVLAQKAVSLEPENATCLLCSSVVFNLIGQTEKALQQVEQAIEVNPNLADGWAYCGLYHAVLGRNDSALEMINFALELSPKDPFRYLWYSHQVICYANEDDYEQALEACKKSTSLNSEWFWSMMAQAQCHAMLEQAEEARECWERAKQLNTTLNLESLKSWLQNSSLDEHQRESIVRALEKAGCE